MEDQKVLIDFFESVHDYGIDLDDIMRFCQKAIDHPEASLRMVESDNCENGVFLALALKSASDDDIRAAFDEERECGSDDED